MVISLHTAQFGSSEGTIIIFDVKNYQMGHILKLNMALTRKFIVYLEKGMPIRLKSIHLINSFPMIETSLNMVKPFIKQSLLKLLHVHTKMDTVYKAIPKEKLPNIYGGSNGSLQTLKENTKNNLAENMAYFQEEERLVVDESKRIEPNKILHEIFDIGIQGSFRKLELD